jgi:secondary thiamine-phosphate synthase enzyme
MEFTVKSEKREEIIDITEKVKEILKNSLERGKAVLVYVPHATCGIIINENQDKNVSEDILAALRQHFPKGVWQHDNIDSNGDAHVKASIIGPSKIIPLENNELQLGTWQTIVLAEFDGPRERRVIMKIL